MVSAAIHNNASTIIIIIVVVVVVVVVEVEIGWLGNTCVSGEIRGPDHIVIIDKSVIDWQS